MLNQLLTGAETLTKTDVMLYSALGFLVVFVGIAFLIAGVWLAGKLISKPKQVEAKPVAPVVAQASMAAADEIDEETLAVIMAALMAYYQTNNPKCEFTVKRIKRI